MNTPNQRTKTGRRLAMLAGSLLWAVNAAAVSLEQIDFVSLPEDSFHVKLYFQDGLPEAQTFAIDNPARIVLDLPGVENNLTQRDYSLSFSNAESANVLAAADRTRLVLNLREAVSYTTRFEGNILHLTVGATGGSGAVAAAGDYFRQDAVAATGVGANQIIDFDFRRGVDGEGSIFLQLASPESNVDVQQSGDLVTVDFFDTSLPDNLRRRFDVVDFATPVEFVEITGAGNRARISIDVSGEYDYLAYQTDTTYVIAIKPLTQAELDEREREFQYTGERLSLNFQDIEVRTVLQLIAEFTGLNLVASDTVGGNITLILDNVPWDQALDIVLKSKGLDKRIEGNVMLVAPIAEIAERERQEVEANKQIEELAPLRTEYFKIKYADAEELFNLFLGTGSGGGFGGAGGSEGQSTASILSERGNAIVDTRTNTIIVTDTEERLADFRRIIAQIDIPVRQVMIEARIVIANTNFRHEVGVRWGLFANDTYSNDTKSWFVGGTREALDDLGETEVDLENMPAGDLGVPGAAGSLDLAPLTEDILIDLELSALENDGYGEIISQPKVLTGDKQEALIRSGTEIAYQEASASGATSVSFKEAVLQLQVTPQITPDDRLILDLLVSQDSVGELVFGGVPTIDVTSLESRVLVDDGQTLVLGGIFQQERVDRETKVPLLGDVPFVGNLFKTQVNVDDKREILIFITPRILSDRVLD